MSGGPSAAETMPCPYCVEQISAQAIVCPHCQRDLQFFTPLRRELRAQAARIAALEQHNARLAELLARRLPGLVLAPQALDAASAAEPVPDAGTDQTLTDWQPSALPAAPWPLRLLRVALPVLALVLAHAIIVLGLDLSELWLRAVSLLLPLALAAGFAWRWRTRLLPQALCALAVALLAVAGMAAVIAHADDVPFWPQDLREWREIALYIASIACSDLTGVLLARLWQWQRLRATRQAQAELAQIMGTGQTTPSPVQRALRQAEALRNAIMLTAPAITAVLSVVTGLRAFFK